MIDSKEEEEEDTTNAACNYVKMKIRRSKKSNIILLSPLLKIKWEKSSITQILTSSSLLLLILVTAKIHLAAHYAQELTKWCIYFIFIPIFADFIARISRFVVSFSRRLFIADISACIHMFVAKLLVLYLSWDKEAWFKFSISLSFHLQCAAISVFLTLRLPSYSFGGYFFLFLLLLTP